MNAEPQPSPGRTRRRVLRGIISLAVTVVLVALVLRAVNLHELAQTLRHASPALLLLAAAAAFAFVLARAWRNRLLLGDSARGKGAELVPMTLASWGTSLVLPGPTGDAVLVWLARTRLRVGIARGTGAVLLARLFDVGSLLAIAVFTAPLAGIRVPRAVMLTASLLAVVAVVGLGALFSRRPRALVLRALRPLPIAGRYVGRAESTLNALSSQGNLLGLVASTGAARLATAIQYLALFAAIGHPLGFLQVWFALSVRTLFLAFPVQGVGGLGTTQLWWTGALTLLGWPLPVALAASVAVHVLDLAVSIPQGALGWAILLLRRSATRDRSGFREDLPLAAGRR